MRWIFTALAALGIALPAQADLTAQYETVLSHYYPNGTRDRRAMAPLESLAEIGGTWLQSELLFQDGRYVREMAENFCTRVTFAIENEVPFGFTMLRFNKGGFTGFQQNYVWNGYNTFARVTDLGNHIDLLMPGSDPAEIEDTTLRRILSSATLSNTAIVRMVGSDVLIIEPVGGAPEIYTRCPA